MIQNRCCVQFKALSLSFKQSQNIIFAKKTLVNIAYITYVHKCVTIKAIFIIAEKDYCQIVSFDKILPADLSPGLSMNFGACS